MALIVRWRWALASLGRWFRQPAVLSSAAGVVVRVRCRRASIRAG